ncbi:MAG: type 4a pilus biogenesis protein PilO [Deltaproteobacteria bacterium]|nr:type 4a pilus biogenesis protein PilO [Deltaproteobacteria bacterium]
MKRSFGREYTKGTTLFLICAALLVIVLFFFLWIAPLQDSLAVLDEEIAVAKARVDIQEKIRPLYAKLAEKAKSDESARLPLPKKESLPKLRIESILPAFSEIAKKHDMKIESFNPVIEALDQTPGRLRVDMSIVGNFFDFRELLVDMGAVPYVESIEEIQIERADTMKRINMKVWLLVS